MYKTMNAKGTNDENSHEIINCRI